MNQKVFEEYSVPRAVFSMAIPTMLSMLVTIFYNMADTFFIGQTGDANQVAAVSLASPFFMLYMACGNIFGMGGSSCISRTLGEGDGHKVKHFSSFCFYGCIFVGIVMSVFSLLFMEQLLPALGCSPATTDFTRDYLSLVSYGGTFIVISSAFGNLIRGEGSAKASMTGMMIGTITNIILDPVMILWMGMGVKGAALATVIGNIAATVYYMLYFTRKDTALSISPKNFTVKDGICNGVLSIGIPVFISNILMSVSSIILNNFLSSYGDAPVAAMGVAMRANMLVFMLQMGVGSGVMPLIGYAYGNKDYKKQNHIMGFSMLFTFILGSALTLLYMIFTDRIIRIFIEDTQVIEYGILMLRALMLAGPVVGIMFVFNFAFQAMGKATAALVLSLSRQGLVFLPVLFIMNRLVGLNGIIYTQPVSDFASIFISIAMYLVMSRKLKTTVTT